MTTRTTASRLGGFSQCGGIHPNAPARAELGSATAEFAIAFLALIATLIPLLSGIEYGVRQAHAQEIARAAARQIARGDDAGDVLSRAQSALPGVALRSWPDAGVTRVQVSAEVRLLMGITVPLTATATTTTELVP